MPSTIAERASVAAVAAAVLTAGPPRANAAAVDELIAKIKDKDDDVRGEAWLNGAPAVGAPAVKPLAGVMADADFEAARAAKRGLWRITRNVGRPDADAEKKAVVAELIPLLRDDRPANVKRELMWMVSELAGDEAVEPMAALLKDKDLREDARMVLQRLPGDKSLAALRAGLDTVPADFKPNIAESLRARGLEISGVPDQKLVPLRLTTVKPLGEAAAKGAKEAPKSPKSNRPSRKGKAK
jgi:hypothetical protein